MYSTARLGALALLAPLALAQTPCATSIAPSGSIKPSIASGYRYAVVATGLTNPRSLEFDADGNLFVLEQNKGLSKHVLQDDGGVCISVASSSDVISDQSLTHGLAMNGTTIWVSSAETLYRVTYDAGSGKIAADSNTTVVTGMEGTDHTTRTLLIPPGMNAMIVARGSSANIDPAASDEASGHSTVKLFDLGNVPSGGYVHNASGTLLGWGLRNDVGVAIHPATGGIWTVENSVDQLTRDGTDVHLNNPAEELNFLGFLNGSNSPTQGSNFGYPDCYTAWRPSEMPNNANIDVGAPFAPSSSNDSACKANTTAARLGFQAHMAPLDIKFNDSATEAWISFHGSWDSMPPVGYGVARTTWGSDGEPTEPSTSNEAAEFIFNQDTTNCPDNCFRPAGLAFDSKGRLFVASDASGEVYVIERIADASSPGNSSGNSTGSGSGNSTGGGPGSGAEGRPARGTWAVGVTIAVLLFTVLL